MQAAATQAQSPLNMDPMDTEPDQTVFSKRLIPAAGLLETLGMPRDEFAASLSERARERLLQLIPTLPPAKLRALLDASFEHIRDPEYEPVVLTLLQHTTDLSAEMISALADPERGLLELVPLPCRHRVWDSKPELFVAETHSSIIEFTEKSKIRPDLLGLLGHHQTRQRRNESGELQNLLRLVGSRKLFTELLGLLREIYVNTGDGVLALLRCDLTMALHEAQEDARPAAKWDSAHKLIWCMDACQRDGQVELRMLKELSARLLAAGVPTYGAAPAAAAAAAAASAGAAASDGGAAALPELAFALSAPPSLQLIARATLERLEACSRAEELPQQDTQLPPLVTMLVVGSYATLLLKGATAIAADRWNVAVAALVQRVLPLVCAMMVDDRIAQLAQAPGGGGVGGGVGGGGLAGGGATELPAPHASLPKLLKSHIAVAPRLVLLYALRRLNEGDEARMCQLLPLLAPLGEGLEPQLDFVAALADLLVARPALLTARLCEAALHRFLLPLSACLEPCHTETLRLLEQLTEPLQRLRAGLDAGSGSMFASVLSAAREQGLVAGGGDDDLRGRWQRLQGNS